MFSNYLYAYTDNYFLFNSIKPSSHRILVKAPETKSFLFFLLLIVLRLDLGLGLVSEKLETDS